MKEKRIDVYTPQWLESSVSNLAEITKGGHVTLGLFK